MIDPSQIPPPGPGAGPMGPPSDLGSPGPMGEAMAPALGMAGPAVGPPGVPPLPGGGPVMAADQMAPAEKKPPLLLPPKLAKELARGYVDQVRAMAGMITEQTGPPDEWERTKVKEQVRAWNKRNPKMDPLALKEQGLSPVEIRDKVYPLRRVLLKLAGPSPKDRARLAERMKAETGKADTITSSDSGF